MSYNTVNYQVYNTLYSINKILRVLNEHKILGFDVETRSIYTAEQVKEAKELLKHPKNINPCFLINVKKVAKSSGLSHPTLIRTTHFIFGITSTESVILIAHDEKTEMAIWNWIVKYKGKFLIHNSGFDLKICYQRTGKLPVNFEDTQLIAKCYINNADNWKAKVGLKVLMGGYYNPKWSMYEDYNIKNINDTDFLEYCAIDGSSVVMLYRLLQEHKESMLP